MERSSALAFETNKVIPARPEQVIEVLVRTLKKAGWESIDVHPDSFSLTAELINTDPSPQKWFVAIATCIPCDERTELLFSIATNNWESAKQKGTVIMGHVILELGTKANGKAELGGLYE